jgi:hypothetical protein
MMDGLFLLVGEERPNFGVVFVFYSFPWSTVEVSGVVVVHDVIDGSRQQIFFHNLAPVLLRDRRRSDIGPFCLSRLLSMFSY